MLGIPPQELWERVPGATQQDVARWKAAAQQGDSFQVLADLLKRQAGISPQAAQQTALTRVAGAVGRHVLQGGRDTLVRSTGQDRRAKGWGRVTGDNACDFCEELAGRGAVYRGQDTAEFEAHDHCACMAEPGF
jgi:hypothetical protein